MLKNETDPHTNTKTNTNKLRTVMMVYFQARNSVHAVILLVVLLFIISSLNNLFAVSCTNSANGGLLAPLSLHRPQPHLTD